MLFEPLDRFLLSHRHRSYAPPLNQVVAAQRQNFTSSSGNFCCIDDLPYDTKLGVGA
jgi:hypothetical protein